MRAWENWWVCESVWVCVRDIFVNAHTNGNNPNRPTARFHLWTSEVHKWSAFWTCILPVSKTQLFLKSCVLDSAKRILLPTFSFMRVLGFKKSKQMHTKLECKATQYWYMPFLAASLWIQITFMKFDQSQNLKRNPIKLNVCSFFPLIELPTTLWFWVHPFKGCHKSE